MKNLLCIFLVSLSGPLLGQKLTFEQTREDLNQLKDAIEAYNPALEIYNPAFADEVGTLLTKIPDDSVSLIEAFRYISTLCALSNEGHFALGNWQDEVHAGFLENKYHYLPISVNVLQEKLIVWIDISNEQSLNRGDEILSINGMPTKDILEEFYKSYPSDGQITTYIDRNIELGFSWMFYLYISQSDAHVIEINDSTGTVKKHSIQALTRKAQFDNFAKYYPERSRDSGESDAFFNLEYDGDAAYLTLPSFDYQKVEEFKINSKHFYKDIFKGLAEKQIKYLVVDLRGNTGGRNEFADDIVPFILKKEVDTPFLKKTTSWEGKTKTYRFMKPSKLAFPGQIYVLVDGRTYSAGNTLARYLHEYADATIIGEETGTRYEGFAAGSKQYITLQNTQLRIGIPRYHIFFPTSAKQTTSNRGLLPHYTVEYSIEDLGQKKDLHLEQVQTFIANSKTSTKTKLK